MPDDQRQQLLIDAAALTAPAGTLAVKEWLRESGWTYYAGFLADRYISGDRSVRFMPHEELSAIVEHATPESEGWRTTCETFVPPRKANVLLTRQRANSDQRA